MNPKLDTKRIAIFLAFAFGIAWAFGLAVYLTGGMANSAELIPGTGITRALALIAGGYMFAPTLAHVLTRWLTKEGWRDLRLRLHFSDGWPYWAIAWFLPALLTFLGAAIYFVVFPAHFDASLSFVQSQLQAVQAQSGRAVPLDPTTVVLIQLVEGILISPLLNGLFTFGEEFGWRAYLQPKLLPLGFRKAMLSIGVIWGVWHWPVIAMGHNYGFDYPGYPWAGMLAMVWVTLGLGIVFGWLVLKGKSVWPAVIAHAAVNGISAAAVLFTDPNAATNPLVGPLPVGFLGGLPWTLLAAWLLWKGDPRDPEEVSRETSPPRSLPVPPNNAIYAEDLSKQFGDVKAVDGLDLDIPAGEVFGLLGPNGAGKTTTIRMLSALVAPTRGDAVVAGHRLGQSDNALRKAVGILTEAPGMYEQLSAESNLAFFAQLYEVPDVDAQVKRYLQMLGLWERREDAVGTFSKGMRQKLAIARALLHEPVVLFLDEPTSGLDPEAARIVREFIGELRGEGRTIVLTTHNLDEADRLCDRIAVFKGHLLAVDTPTNLRRKLYGRAVVFHLAALDPRFVKALEGKSYVESAKTVDNKLVVTLEDPEAHNPELVRELVGLGAQIQFVGELRQSLEDVYFKLVDKQSEVPS